MKIQKLRDHQFLGTTQSLCPHCLDVVQAKIIVRDGRVYFQKFCPAHGPREDFVCSDANWFDRDEFNVPGREPLKYGVEPNRGCPYDCGLCTQHEQHTCIGLLELTDSCNLTCPMCYASSAPGGKHLSLADCQRAIGRLVEVEGRAEILQLSGGEPTLHPKFAEIFSYACDQPIDLVMVNTNGIRIANDRKLCELLASRAKRCQVYLQMDAINGAASPILRGEQLQETKLRAVERLGEYGISTTLVATLQTDVNLDQIGPLVDFARQRSWITGVSFQPATYVGRCIEPDELERRITFPDVIHEVCGQTNGQFSESDFFPIPCAHPNSHSLCYAFRSGESVIPITRFVDLAQHFDLLANGISLTREGTKHIIEAYLLRNACGPGCDCGSGRPVNSERASLPLTTLSSATSIESGGVLRKMPGADEHELARRAETFFARALAEDLAAADMFRITTTSFMDAYNFDIRQLIKSCVHHVLPSGHIIPFDAYNIFYRTGRLPLPQLARISDAALIR